MSIDTYPPQSTQATVVNTVSLSWVSSDNATGAAVAPLYWADAQATSKTAEWRVPENYAGGDATFSLFRRPAVTGTAVMNYSVYRMRHNAALVVIASAVAANYIAADTNSSVLSLTIPAGNFVSGDVLYMPIVRLGADAADTLAGGVYCDGMSLTYSAYVMGYAAYPASVNNASYEEGTFTVTATGFSGTAPSGTAYYIRVGKQVTVEFPAFSGISNATTFTMIGLPVGLQPARAQLLVAHVVDTNLNQIGMMAVDPSGVISLYKPDFSGFAASSTKGIQNICLHYGLL